MNENYLRGGLQGAAMGYQNKSAAMSQDCQPQACEARQSAQSLMRQQVKNLRREADRLEALADAMPLRLPEPADAALWELLNRR